MEKSFCPMGTPPPRTLIISYAPPDGKYIVLRRIVERFPEGTIAWVSTLPLREESRLPFPYFCAAPRRPHWRLGGTGLDSLLEFELQTRALARRTAEWVQTFQPQVIWGLAEQGAAQLGYQLHRRLNIPVHAMVQDAHQTAWHKLPRFYYPFYDRSVLRFLRSATTFDAICGELVEWTQTHCRNLRSEDSSMVFSPSVSRGLMDSVPRPDCFGDRDEERRIGLCGTMRIGPAQWQSFLGLLSRLPWRFRLLATVNREALPDCEMPSNVGLDVLPFAPSEEDVIRGMHASGVHACYLGLWKEPRQNLFSRTSLSAKLTTYAAARLPVIVDGPVNSSAWRLVKTHEAGVLCGESSEASLAALTRLFARPDDWRRMSEGAGAFCRAEFCLEDNVGKFFGLLNRCAGGEN